MHVVENPSREHRALALFVVVVFVGAGLWAVFSPWRRPEGPAPVADYLSALESVKGELRPGARVLVQPPWRDDVVDAIEAAGVLPAGVEATTALALKHLAPTPRMVVLVDDDSPLPRLMKRRLDDATRTDVGDVRVYVHAGSADGFVLDDVISEAKVEVKTRDGKTVACRWNGRKGQHLCPGLPDWMHVGPHDMTSGGKSRSCVWAHPTSGGVVSITWPALELSGALEISHALSDSVTKGQGAPVETTVFVDDKRVGKVVQQNRPGFSSKTFPLEAAGPVRVRLEVTTDDDGARHYCVSARAVEGR